MTEVEQRPIADDVTLPAGADREYRYEADEVEYLSIVELSSGALNTIIADVRVLSEGGQPTSILARADDGDSDPADDRLGVTTSEYPIPVSDTVAETRYLMLVRLDPGDQLRFLFRNTDGGAAHNVRFRGEVASTLEAALASVESGRGGTRG